MASSKWFDLHYHQLLIEPGRNGWFIVWPDGSRFDGQCYRRPQDARRAITLMKKDYNASSN
jgi:hypothetical protein